MPLNINDGVQPTERTDGRNVSRYSVNSSQSSLIHSVQPSDCASTGYVLGGVTMKMMDEVAGIVAFRHCKTNVVTASVGKSLSSCLWELKNTNTNNNEKSYGYV